LKVKLAGFVEPFQQDIGRPGYLKKVLRVPWTNLHSSKIFRSRKNGQDQETRLRMPNKWHICKEGQAGNKSRQWLVFSELPRLPSAGSRPGCFHTSLACKPRSLIRVSLGWIDNSKKNVRKDNPTPAYSPVSDHTLTILNMKSARDKRPVQLA
jgi:hypothetical protein